ncbi:MAG TPA: hypothetical protein VES01_05520 [Dermatophilaceae bacterium]|nr:hypothetical protein [Dermatophilaceae bacterium]
MANRTEPPVAPEPSSAGSGPTTWSRAGRRRPDGGATPATEADPNRLIPATVDTHRSVCAALGEAQGAISVLAAADTALDEIGFLLRRLRAVAVQAAAVAATGDDPSRQQEHVFVLVSEIAAIGARARFNGVRLFDGGLADRIVWVGAAGQPVRVHIDVLNGQVLGLEHPWGHANRAVGMPARLVTSTGTLPSGIFRVAETAVFDETGMKVGHYAHPALDFGGGITATFDRLLYYRDDTRRPRRGTVTLNSVISVRNAGAVDGALVTIGQALAEVSRRRAAASATRLRLADAVATLGLLTASRRADGNRRGNPDPPEILTATTVRELRSGPATAARASGPTGPRTLAGLLSGPGEPPG